MRKRRSRGREGRSKVLGGKAFVGEGVGEQAVWTMKEAEKAEEVAERVQSVLAERRREREEERARERENERARRAFQEVKEEEEEDAEEEAMVGGGSQAHSRGEQEHDSLFMEEVDDGDGAEDEDNAEDDDSKGDDEGGDGSVEGTANGGKKGADEGQKAVAGTAGATVSEASVVQPVSLGGLEQRLEAEAAGNSRGKGPGDEAGEASGTSTGAAVEESRRRFSFRPRGSKQGRSGSQSEGGDTAGVGAGLDDVSVDADGDATATVAMAKQAEPKVDLENWSKKASARLEARVLPSMQSLERAKMATTTMMTTMMTTITRMQRSGTVKVETSTKI